MSIIRFLLFQAIAEKKYIEDYKVASIENAKECKKRGVRWLLMPKEFNRSPSKAYIKDRMKMIRQLCLEIIKEYN